MNAHQIRITLSWLDFFLFIGTAALPISYGSALWFLLLPTIYLMFSIWGEEMLNFDYKECAGPFTIIFEFCKRGLSSKKAN